MPKKRDNKLRLLILGAGAVGGYFGALFQDKGLDVTFLVRKQRAKHLKKHGLKVISPLGDIAVNPKVVTSISAQDNFQLVIISCKSFALNDAVTSLIPLQENNEIYILPLLNGLSHYPKLEKQFGKARVLGGFAHLSSVLTENGNIHHLNKLQVLAIGALEAEQKVFIKACREILSASAPFIIFANNIQLDIWKKVIFISTVAAATCLLKKTMGEIASVPEGVKEISRSFEFNCQAASFAGFAPDEEWKNRTLNELLDPSSMMTSSMLRDIQNGRPAELSILADMIEHNRNAGFHNELLESAYLSVKRYESQRLNV